MITNILTRSARSHSKSAGAPWAVALAAALGILAIIAPGRVFPDSRRPQQDDPIPMGGQPIFLPLTLHAARRNQERFGSWSEYERGAVEALALQRHRLYVGAGSMVVTYDISEPGKARRIGRPLILDGQVTHLAASESRLFATTVSTSDPSGPWLPDPIERRGPPWSSLHVFSFDPAGWPVLLQSVELELDLFKHFAWDLAALDEVAYVAVVNKREDSGNVVCDFDIPCGILVADATAIPARLELRPELTGAAFRLKADGRRLLATGFLPFAEFRDDFRWGLMSFDLTITTSPRRVSLPFHHGLLQLWQGGFLGSDGRHAYLILGGGELLTARWAADGELTYMLPDVEPSDLLSSMPRLANGDQLAGVHQSASINGRLMLLTRESPIHLMSFEVADPLKPRATDELILDGINARQRQNERTWGGLAATDDGRLFVAGGDSGLLVEVNMSQTGLLQELARYEPSRP